MSLFNLKSKVALITGSSKGIGQAIATRMVEQGASVVISSRSQEDCDQVAAGINAQGGTAIAIACNINYKEQLQELVSKTEEQLGRVDILVCNAAINPYFGPSQYISDAAFDKVMHSN
ncbi:MAG: SDR family NAD(P)-dependent oxidoreductase, partial [Proteobacteria bacterium]|nr:SDR family NAD(P)-dependent oxidoreductase [Pseudomonadota bacterium]